MDRFMYFSRILQLTGCLLKVLTWNVLLKVCCASRKLKYVQNFMLHLKLDKKCIIKICAKHIIYINTQNPKLAKIAILL